MKKLVKKIVVTGQIKIKTGIHIGGSNSAMNIGGPDKFVVRNPFDNKPYIPGSSLKGKLRSLIELQDGTISVDNKSAGPTKNPKTKAGNLFGTVEDKKNGFEQQPSRIIIRDCKLISSENEFKNTDMPYTESKTEVAIDRITAKANPRTFERVPSGARFDLNMIINVFEDEIEEDLKGTLVRALDLLQDDYLGGHGSRGYGQVEITNLTFEDRDKSFYVKE
jgi:CRISPR-associated protein Csm3